MRPINHIMLATDFSESVQAATDLAIQFASKFAARLTLLHVFDAPSYVGAFGDVYFAVPADQGKRVRADADRALAQLAERATAAGITTETLVVEGTAHQGILAAAQSRNIDLIVLGSHGRTGLKHMVLGSVAEDVVRVATCPVVTVRSPGAAT